MMLFSSNLEIAYVKSDRSGTPAASALMPDSGYAAKGTEGTPMENQARLLDGTFSKGLETVTALVRCSDFSAELGELIRKPGGAERALGALRREFFPEPIAVPEQVSVTQTNSISPFSAPIVYLQPEFEELKRRFPAYVNSGYKGKRSDPIGRCKGISKENREVAFEYIHMDRKASTDEVLAEMDRKGLRPALYEELLGFAEKYPDEQRKFPIVALGSKTRVGGDRGVAFLCGFGDGRSLDLHWLGLGSDWRSDYRFLAVRK